MTNEKLSHGKGSCIAYFCPNLVHGVWDDANLNNLLNDGESAREL